VSIGCEGNTGRLRNPLSINLKDVIRTEKSLAEREEAGEDESVMTGKHLQLNDTNDDDL
jgi:hypothetical protein